MKLATHCNLMLRLRMNGGIPLILPHAFMLCAAVTCVTRVIPTAVTANIILSMTCADCKCLRGLLPSVFRIEWRMVNYAVMAVEQKICSNTVWQ
jgi:hypothetical protein